MSADQRRSQTAATDKTRNYLVRSVDLQPRDAVLVGTSVVGVLHPLNRFRNALLERCLRIMPKGEFGLADVGPLVLNVVLVFGQVGHQAVVARDVVKNQVA